MVGEEDVREAPEALEALVKEYLSAELTEDARFFAEQLHALQRSEVRHRGYRAAWRYMRECERGELKCAAQESALLLATACKRGGQKQRSLCVLRSCSSERNRLALAQLCLELELYGECDRSLTRNGAHNLPCGGAAGWLALGLARRRTNRLDDAASCFRSALSLDPFLWSAWHQLSALGHTSSSEHLIQSTRPDIRQPSISLSPSPFHPTHDGLSLSPQNGPSQTPNVPIGRSPTSFSHAPNTLRPTDEPPRSAIPHKEPHAEDLTTPTPTQRGRTQPPGAPRPRPTNDERHVQRDRSSASHQSVLTEEDDDARRRKVSHKLFNEAAGGCNARAESSTSAGNSASTRPRSGTRTGAQRAKGAAPAAAKEASDESHEQKGVSGEIRHGAIHSAFNILCACENAYRLLSLFRCEEALKVLKALPQVLYETGWVLHHVRGHLTGSFPFVIPISLTLDCFGAMKPRLRLHKLRW